MRSLTETPQQRAKRDNKNALAVQAAIAYNSDYYARLAAEQQAKKNQLIVDTQQKIIDKQSSIDALKIQVGGFLSLASSDLDSVNLHFLNMYYRELQQAKKELQDLQDFLGLGCLGGSVARVVGTGNAGKVGGQYPPSSNTGGIEDSVGAIAGASDDRVLINNWGIEAFIEDISESFMDIGDKGIKVRVPKPSLKASPDSAFVDWLTFTFKVDDFYLAFPKCRAVSRDGTDLVMAISNELLAVFGFGVTKARPVGMNFYKTSYVVGDSWGFLAIGGQRETVCITINAQGLMASKRGWQKRAFNFGQGVRGKITRVDLARDFFYGEYSVDKAYSDYNAGLFHLGAAFPNIEKLGNWDRPTGRGRTLQIGRRESGKLLRNYEKGKQLGSPYSALYPDWVRVELELHNKDRVIPWEVLIQAGQYLAGSYPALSFINASQSRIKTQKNASKITMERAKEWLKTQCGKYIWLFHALGGEDGLKDFFVHEVPRRLNVPHYADSPPLFEVRFHGDFNLI